ncbi:MAG: HAD family hydrolase [Anaerolineae bacterium]|jgi:soluble P-type ATPase|nr:HAD family hydrolase [Anaerolineae bacterium]MDH7474450.1 HAD family hydrolase [Anaerolineae bacterium]
MLRIDIPGRGTLDLAHLVLDLNGTIALDGEVLPGVAGRLAILAERLTIHLVTADTHGKAAAIVSKLEEGTRGVDVGAQHAAPLLLARIEAGNEAEQKQTLVQRLGAEQVVAAGNGANDGAMLRAAALGIAVLGAEGLAVEALQSANVVTASIEDALDLLIYPKRLVATLRR